MKKIKISLKDWEENYQELTQQILCEGDMEVTLRGY